MSLYYPAGGATAALGVVGLCEFAILLHWSATQVDTPTNRRLTDMLFNGEGEQFNVRGTIDVPSTRASPY